MKYVKLILCSIIFIAVGLLICGFGMDGIRKPVEEGVIHMAVGALYIISAFAGVGIVISAIPICIELFTDYFDK